MGHGPDKSTCSAVGGEVGADAPSSRHNRRLDLLAFGVISLVVTVSWLPTLTSGRRIVGNDDFLLHAARHEAVRRSLVQYHTFPFRSHWFGGGYATLGEPQDPALNPLVLLSVLFGSVMGLKLIGFVAALVSGLSTYALARYILDYTRWGGLFAALVVGTSICVPGHVAKGNFGEMCTAYVPLCALLIGLACRGRRGALFVLPFVLYTMLSDGKQAFFMAMLYVGLLCLLDAAPAFRTLARGAPAGKLQVRALTVLVLALGVTLLVGMVRILPALEFISAGGGLAHLQIHPYAGRAGTTAFDAAELLRCVLGVQGGVGFATVGWLPILLFGVGLCCMWKRGLPWAIALVLSGWLCLGDRAPYDLFGLLQRLPIFGAIGLPSKYVWFPIVLSIALGAGLFFRLLGGLQRRWLEHFCAVALIVAELSFLCPKTASCQYLMYGVEIPSEALIPQERFHSVQGSDLPRRRVQPPHAVTYYNILRNVGTIDWYTAIPTAENAIPRYFVDADNNFLRNPGYLGEAFLVDDTGKRATAGSVASWALRPNSIAVQVTMSRPGTLVINQNYHPAWKADRGELYDRDGLVALRLQEAGSYMVRLQYLPSSFVVGLAISLLGIAGWAVACWAFRPSSSFLTPSTPKNLEQKPPRHPAHGHHP